MAGMLGRSLGQALPGAAHPAASRPLAARRGPRGARRRRASPSRSAPGEIVGLAGLVGAGRSELAHAIFGAARATRGPRRARGRRGDGVPPRARCASGLALIPESRKRRRAHARPARARERERRQPAARSQPAGSCRGRERRQVAGRWSARHRHGPSSGRPARYRAATSRSCCSRAPCSCEPTSAHRRRADAGHRRRAPAVDLRAAHGARRGGRGHPPHLERGRGGARPRPSRARHARRTHRRRLPGDDISEAPILEAAFAAGRRRRVTADAVPSVACRRGPRGSVRRGGILIPFVGLFVLLALASPNFLRPAEPAQHPRPAVGHDHRGRGRDARAHRRRHRPLRGRGLCAWPA